MMRYRIYVRLCGICLRGYELTPVRSRRFRFWKWTLEHLVDEPWIWWLLDAYPRAPTLFPFPDGASARRRWVY